MLKRRCAGVAAAALLLALAQPLAPPAEARAAAPTWLSRIAGDFMEAHRITRGKGVRIALLSDGVAPGVATLDGALEKGRDFVGTPRPKRELGTLLASLIVGGGPTADAPLGVRGLASAATLLPVRVYATPREPGGRAWANRDMWDVTLAKGIRYAVDQGAQVIAVEPYSLNGHAFGGSPGGSLPAAIAYAQSKDSLVIAAAGVQETYRVAYPGVMAGVVGVGAVNEKGRRSARFTSGTTAVLLSAPGFKVPLTGPDNRLWTVWGHPVAMSWAAGAAALVRARYPELTAAQVVQALTSSARHPKGKGRYDTDLGFGYVNAVGALNAARELSGKPAPPVAAKVGVVKDGAHFGERRGTVRAVPYDPAVLGGFGALTLAGLAAVVLAGWMLVRRRRWRRLPAVPEVAEAGPVAPESAGADSA
ncbi:S8 family serine peptidase [Spirillospora sp. NPDC029432]|uniref:S8 family serine peptidase n=1 Tax=Spirillospora sp. NPDC029432 TaxID=3154599 RepID=UPI003453144A